MTKTLKRLLLSACLFTSCQLHAQKDTLAVTLTPFIKKEKNTEVLYLTVYIQSNSSDSIEIDDTRSWIRCIDPMGVRLIMEYILEGNAYEPGGSDCDPVFDTNGQLMFNTKKYTLPPYGTYTYDVQLYRLCIIDEKGLQPTRFDRTPYRFKLELPYRYGNHSGKFISKRWTYFVYAG